MTAQAENAEYRKENLLLKKQIEDRTGKTVGQLYAERAKRVQDVVELRTPDRVPFMVLVEAHNYSGIPKSAAFYDPIALKRTMRKMAVDLEPDMSEPGFPSCGAAMTELGVQNCVWPGGPKPEDYEYQFIEGEYMKEDEYDLFVNDPSGFMLRCYLPRVYRTLMPLAKLPPLDSMFMGLEAVTPLFASPEFQEMARRLAKAGEQMQKFSESIGDASEELAQLGFPPFARFAAGGVGGAPFDTLTSFLRGMKGSMLDMYRRPDKLLKACDVILERRIANAFPADPASNDYPPRVGLPLWRGDPVFMSDAQFRRFYWPGLKKSLQTHIDLGYMPAPFFEAPFGDRLECLLELPKGKVLASIDAADAVRAKEILGGHTSLLVRCPNTCKLWSIAQLESFITDLIDKSGKDGGLIIVIPMPDRVRIEDMQTMLQSVKKYGQY